MSIAASARKPPQFVGPRRVTASERAELLQMLRADGILYRSETQPVLSRDGSSGRWMLDSLRVTLTPRGGELAARCLLGVLDSFEGRQLATLGLTGVPLLQGCVLHGCGRFRGALVRKEAKSHGSLKIIEGELDKAEPVVIVDDSISSGLSMWTCADRLEEAGFHVEGCVCLVRFRYELGTAKLLERGFRVASVFDIYEDFIRYMDGEAPYPLNPTKTFGELSPSPRRASEGLHPAQLAREVIAEYLSSGQVLGAPDTMDTGYDAAGGCWVSLRRRSAIYDRLARNGFWNFPEEQPGRAEKNVVLAAVHTAQELQHKHTDPCRVLDECAIAVTFFSALDECTVGELDNDRYGIVVRSADRAPRMGGALPRMPGIGNEWDQFFHAWHRNAKLFPLEPYHLYRHEVRKVVEPGAVWQPTGAPDSPRPAWPLDTVVALATGARARVLCTLGGSAGADGMASGSLLSGVVGAFVTVYANGRVAGCAGGFAEEFDTSIGDYAETAVHDARFATPPPDAEIAVSVSLLCNRHEIGVASPEWVVHPTRFAEQALEVRQGDRMGIVLPFVAVTHNLTPQGYVNEVVDKAGITRPPYHWTRYDCATWLADATGVRRLENGLPQGEPAATAGAQARRLRELLTDYAARHHVSGGEPVNRYEVFGDRLRTGVHPARLAYGAWIKARACLHEQCADDLRRLEQGSQQDGWLVVGGHPPSIAELAFTVLARLESGSVPESAMVARLWSQIDVHGRFTAHRDRNAAEAAYQDYAPGQALLAMAHAAERGAGEPEQPALRRALRHYRMRFRQNHHWGAVAWLTQAFTAWARVLGDPSLNDFAYEVADWALGFQSTRTGAFLNDHQPDTPGATTALYLEGIAAVRAAADDEGETAREARYRSSCVDGLRFLDKLVYQERDTAVLPNPRWAIGGLRTSLTASDVRTDYVHHALGALLRLRPVLEQS